MDATGATDSDDRLFQCGICLELWFKPIVHACGHIFCFWCVHLAMDGLGTSQCPMCRSPYTQFPRICAMLHRLLAKTRPEEYAQRKNEVQEMEKSRKISAPAMEQTFDGVLQPADLACEHCKRLIYLPVVLNCGHAFCQSCVEAPDEGGCPKCPSCGMIQKIFPVQVCLELNEYVRNTYHVQSKQRETEELSKPERVKASASSASPTSPTSSRSDSGRPEVGLPHSGVGCDGCGVCPIVGTRYRCEDCPDKIGYDLCEECHSTSTAPDGRFNQQHTAEHRMEEMKIPRFFGLVEIYPE